MTIDEANMPVGTTIIMSGQSMEEMIAMAIHMWSHEQPNEVRAYKQHMDRRRSEMNTENGMSEGGTMRAVAELPPRLHKVFLKVVGKDYMQDKSFMRCLWREAPGFFVSRASNGGAGV